MIPRREGSLLILGAAVLIFLILGSGFSLLNNPSLSFPGLGVSSAEAKTFAVRSRVSGSWGDQSIWNEGLPSEGDTVIISQGTTVTYDLQRSPVFMNIVIEGALLFTRMHSTTLSARNITVIRTGYLEIGTEDDPVPPHVTAVVELDDISEGGARIGVWGHIELHGTPLTRTFTKLAQTAEKGSTTITLANNVPWKPGDRVVITSTSLNHLETEENVIASLSGDRITLAQPLKYSHDGIPPAQGEVAALTRNVLVTSKNPRIHAEGVIFGEGAKAGISYAEFRDLGGKSRLGKYPIHFHHARQTMVGTVIQGVSVWNSNNRFITIHDTDGIIIKDSVGYRVLGHGFFLEDGNEMNNVLENNLAILILPGTLRPDDSRPAGFWVQNPRNKLFGNIAVSAYGSGFELAIPERAPEVIPFDDENFHASSWRKLHPRQLKILEFAGNEAHSNRMHGVNLYRLNTVRQGGISWFKELKLWRNGGIGITITASQANITTSIFFGNSIANMQIDARDMTIRNSTFLGELGGIQTSSRYMESPVGLLVSGSGINIMNNLLQGHARRGNLAFGDIIHQPRGHEKTVVLIQGTQLRSQHKIIFGYPLNGDSYFKVINGDGSEIFFLYRYDTNYGLECQIDTGYMAIKCPIQVNPRSIVS